MTSFLERLFKYQATEGRSPQEDFFTEALAGVLEAHPQMVADFAKWLTGREFKSADVATQKGVSGGNRLDMWLKAQDDDDRNHLIVLENKLGSKEGRDQLRRYECYLARQKAESRTLVYLSMHERSDFQPSTNSVSFLNRHWFEVYNWLKDQIRVGGDGEARANVLIGELLRLMEAWDMEMHLGAHDLASAVAYKGRVESQLLQILNTVWEECRKDCVSGGGSRWAYNDVYYQSAYVTDDHLYYDFGFDFKRDDGQWTARDLQLPSAYFGVRRGDAEKPVLNGLSEEWVKPPWTTTWNTYERVRQLVALKTSGSSLHEGYLDFFLSSLEQARAAIGNRRAGKACSGEIPS